MGRDLQAIRAVARQCNEFNAKLGVDHPGRFGSFATLPLLDIDGSLREAEYALDVLKADGICMRTPYGNLWHGDPIFAPLFEELNRRNAVIFTHPQDAHWSEGLVPGVETEAMIEYGTHTTRTIVSLLESGAAARYPEHPLGLCPRRRHHAVSPVADHRPEDDARRRRPGVARPD